MKTTRFSSHTQSHEIGVGLKRIAKGNAYVVSVLVVVLVGLAYVILNFDGDRIRGVLRADNAYKLLPPVLDPEHRTEKLGETWRDEPLDLSAFVGMPDAYRDLVSVYVQTVCSEIGASPLMRKRYYHKGRSNDRGKQPNDRFPDDTNPIYDREIVVPLVVLPRPEAVNIWTTSSEARIIGWRPVDAAFHPVGSVYGRTLIFEPGECSEEPHTLPAAPIGASIPSWNEYVPDLDYNVPFFLPLQKVIVQPFRRSSMEPLLNGAEDLRLGEEGGAKLVGELRTVPAYIKNIRLKRVACTNGSTCREFLAYSLIDGNGAKRATTFQDFGSGRLSPYFRPLRCESHQPQIMQHDLLLLPTPIAWPPSYWELKDINAHEEWCLDDWFPAQQDSCWVIRETAESKPLQESFILMPASEKSDLPVFFVALFAETEPVQLVKELAALYRVSADKIFNSPATMKNLTSLYEKVRDFPIAK